MVPGVSRVWSIIRGVLVFWPRTVLAGAGAVLRVAASWRRPPEPPLQIGDGAARPTLDEDLHACPRRLESLEVRLTDRLRAVKAQAARLRERRGELGAKAGREDLLKKYDQDLGLLDRRTDSMRRVLGLVWKTRSILELRAHLAQTARRRPALSNLPRGEQTDRARLEHAAAAWHRGAAEVGAYLAFIDQRADTLAWVVPAAPDEAEVAGDVQAAVDGARDETVRAYQDLREEMDRLRDNLNWLGDHCGALAVIEAPAERRRGDAGPAELLAEVEEALGQLAALARTVDPQLADTAVSNLAEDISQLEEAGLEAQAEADAELEIERLLRTA